jgi:ribosomal protein S18 acetylase RimI-like enzyme
MEIRKAIPNDCRAIAELALMAGEGIPAYFWQDSQQPGQEIEDVGADKLKSESENFSYRNTLVATTDNQIAGMMLAYRLKDEAEDLDELPDFIRPLIELEQCVPGTFYINMLATYPKYRNMAIGTTLIQQADSLAQEQGCDTTSIQVFDENEGALRLYIRLGYQIADSRKVIPHHCHPYTGGEVLLLTRPVAVG